MALIQVRLGALLIDMYVAGYCLDADGNLVLEPLVFDSSAVCSDVAGIMFDCLWLCVQKQEVLLGFVWERLGEM